MLIGTCHLKLARWCCFAACRLCYSLFGKCRMSGLSCQDFTKDVGKETTETSLPSPDFGRTFGHCSLVMNCTHHRCSKLPWKMVFLNFFSEFHKKSLLAMFWWWQQWQHKLSRFFILFSGMNISFLFWGQYSYIKTTKVSVFESVDQKNNFLIIILKHSRVNYKNA